MEGRNGSALLSTKIERRMRVDNTFPTDSSNRKLKVGHFDDKNRADRLVRLYHLLSHKHVTSCRLREP